MKIWLDLTKTLDLLVFVMPKTKYQKNYIHPKLIALEPSPVYDERGIAVDFQDPFFSKAPCDCCDYPLAGDRYECDAVIDSKHSHPLTLPKVYACLDCVIKFR